MKNRPYLYRFFDVRMCGYDDYAPSRVEVRLDRFPIEKFTPKGFWIREFNGVKRFVLNSGRKRFAYPDLVLAKESFIRRKEVQESIYLARARQAREAIEFITSGTGVRQS